MRRHDITICIALAASACSSQSDPTGSYIASDANGAFMVQIVSVLDGRVAGTLSILSVKPNGRIDAVRRPLAERWNAMRSTSPLRTERASPSSPAGWPAGRWT